MSNDVPLLVEYKLDNLGYVRYYLVSFSAVLSPHDTDLPKLMIFLVSRHPRLVKKTKRTFFILPHFYNPPFLVY